MPRRKIGPTATAEGIIAEESVVPVDHSEPATAEIVTLRPAQWDEHGARIEAEIAAVELARSDLTEQLKLALRDRTLGAAHAEERVEGVEADIRATEAKLARLRLQLADVHEQCEQAIGREDAAAHQRQLVAERLKLVSDFDAQLRQLGPVATALQQSSKTLSALSGVTGVSIGQMSLTASFVEAVFVAAPALAELLQLPRGKALPAMQPLTITEGRRRWSRFTPDLPAVTEAATSAPAAPAIDADLGRHGGRALDRLNLGGTIYEVLDPVPGAVLTAMPLANRRALLNAGRIEFLPAPQPETSQSE
jgi:hypothetical protein